MKNFAEPSARTSFAALTTEFAMQTRTLSRSRAFRSKRHAAGTSPAHKWIAFKTFHFVGAGKSWKISSFGKTRNLS